MHYREARPSAHLVDIVDRFWSVDYDSGPEAPPEPVLPDGCPEIIFNLADRFQRIPSHGDIETQATAIVSGQLRRRLMIRPTGRVSLFGIRFRPHAASILTPGPMRELTDHVVPLADVVGSLSRELEARIVTAASFKDRIAVFEAVLTSRLEGYNGDSSIAGILTRMIAAENGGLTVRELSNRSGVGERRIERIFDKHVGVSPKVFGRIVRFAGAVRSIERAATFELLDTALSYGYYDQSHMIHEFNEFAGTSPLQYFEATHRLSELFTS